MRTPPTHFVGEPGSRIAYATFGRGRPPVLLLPHWASNIEAIWSEPAFARFATKLASIAEVVHFDKRGVGLSDNMPGDQLPALETATADALAAMDATRHNRVVIVAADMAGPLAIYLASTSPHRVAGLVLLGTTARLRRDDDYPFGFNDVAMRYAIDVTERGWIEGGAEAVRRQEPSLADDVNYVGAASRYRRATISPARARAIAEQLSAWDVRDHARRITCQTWIVHRRDDRYIPASHGRFLATLIPGAELIELAGADHTPWSGNQDEVLDTIAGALRAMGSVREPVRAQRRARFAPRFGWQSLTDAERTVVALLADGSTNKEAASALHVSARTVETHLQSAYTKLGINTRAELAREALRHQDTRRQHP